MENNQYNVKSLGKCTVESPLKLSNTVGDGIYDYVTDNDRVLQNTALKSLRNKDGEFVEPVSFEKAGPRELLYFEPAKTKVGMVTCGGLCPGLNDVIRSLVMHLNYRYGINRIVGFKYGYKGLIPKYKHPTIELTPDYVADIHRKGGTVLGSSRGMQDVSQIVDTIERQNINVMFCIGGDGTLRGAHAIYEEIAKRNLKIAVAGIPKTIDNDINLIERSFGFETAFSVAHDIIRNGVNEALGAYNGIGLVKLMGRDSGFIAANAALSFQEVDFVLIPEMNFELYGENGLLNTVKRHLEKYNHCMIVVAEGAGQNLFKDKETVFDASGNVLHKDIGVLLREKISHEFKKLDFPFSIKYIDPSYYIRSVPANANDSKFCNQLAQNAVHAALAGKTDFVIGNCHGYFTLVPIIETVRERKKIDIESELWWNVLEATGQPRKMKND